RHALVTDALIVMPAAEYRRPDRFDSITKARELAGFIEGRLASFPGVSIAGDVAWEWPPSLPVDKLCHWEATANLVFSGQEVRTICQYDLSADSPAVIHTALRTHSQVILRQAYTRTPLMKRS